MDLKLILILCLVVVIAAFLELSYFSYNGRKMGLISRIILSLLFPLILIIGFVVGSIFLFFVLGIIVFVLIVSLIVFCVRKFSKNKEDIIIIKRKK